MTHLKFELVILLYVSHDQMSLKVSARVVFDPNDEVGPYIR